MGIWYFTGLKFDFFLFVKKGVFLVDMCLLSTETGYLGKFIGLNHYLG